MLILRSAYRFLHNGILRMKQPIRFRSALLKHVERLDLSLTGLGFSRGIILEASLVIPNSQPTYSASHINSSAPIRTSDTGLFISELSKFRPFFTTTFSSFLTTKLLIRVALSIFDRISKTGNLINRMEEDWENPEICWGRAVEWEHPN